MDCECETRNSDKYRILRFGLFSNEFVIDDLNDDDDDLLMLGGKRKVKEDSALSKVEQEIKELEIFSNIPAFPAGLGPSTSRSAKNNAERLRINIK